MWKPLCGFQAAVDGALSVHGGGSVHAVVNSGRCATNFHHLTGHYLMRIARLRENIGDTCR